MQIPEHGEKNKANKYFYYALYLVSVFSLAKSLQLILEISATYRLASKMLLSLI